MQGFRNELRHMLAGPALPAFWAIMTLVLGLSGPLGTYENCTFAHRTMFWSVVIGSVILTNAVICAAVWATIGRLSGTSGIPLVSAAVTLVLFAPVTAVAQGQIVQDHPMFTASTAETMTFLFLTALGIGGYNLLARADVAAPAAAAPASASTPEGQPAPLPRLVMRLDPALRGDLYAITGRDHYVDIRTSKGAATILMRFSDAMLEAAPVAGGQVHRSHWVAWGAVTAAERAAGKLHLALADGSRVPVSRTYQDAVAARGLLPSGG
jgi:hypothetical protein